MSGNKNQERNRQPQKWQLLKILLNLNNIDINIRIIKNKNCAMILQNNNPSQLFFHEQTDTFDLSITLTVEQRLSINLQDFADWIIYSKEYTEEDVGKEIHKKMEIKDIYTAFWQTGGQCDGDGMKEKWYQGNQIKKYEFGTVVESGSKKLPCYKIEKEGKITVYLVMIDKRTGKDVTYESRLTLSKVRNMTEAEISADRLRSTNEKNHIFEELIRQIQKEKQEKHQISKRLLKLEQQNEKTKQELTATKNILKQMLIKQEMTEKLQERVALLQSGMDQTKIESIPKKQQIQQKLSSKKNTITPKKYEASTKINQLKSESEELPLLGSRSDETSLMTLSQAGSSQFKVNGFKLRSVGGYWSWNQYIFGEPINHNQIANFSIKIIKARDNGIMIGVVDYAQQKDQKYSHDSGNALCYFGKNGRKYPEQVIEGYGFQQNDIVEVQVNRATNTINYLVNGVLQASDCNQMLGDSSRVFMPYVEMLNSWDEVKWLM